MFKLILYFLLLQLTATQQPNANPEMDLAKVNSTGLIMPKLTGLEVDCENHGMNVRLTFDGPYNGIVYSKGHYNDPKCRHVQENSGQVSYKFVIIKSTCGTEIKNLPSHQNKRSSVENILVIRDNATYEMKDSFRKISCILSETINSELPPFPPKQPPPPTAALPEAAVVSTTSITWQGKHLDAEGRTPSLVPASSTEASTEKALLPAPGNRVERAPWCCQTFTEHKSCNCQPPPPPPRTTTTVKPVCSCPPRHCPTAPRPCPCKAPPPTTRRPTCYCPPPPCPTQPVRCPCPVQPPPCSCTTYPFWTTTPKSCNCQKPRAPIICFCAPLPCPTDPRPCPCPTPPPPPPPKICYCPPPPCPTVPRLCPCPTTPKITPPPPTQSPCNFQYHV